MSATDGDGTTTCRVEGTTIAAARGDDVIRIEGNTYFPPSAVRSELLAESDTLYFCSWKGRAQYYDVIIDGNRYRDAAWSYPFPSESAIRRVGRDFSSYVAFDHHLKGR